jgi:transcriptional regulator with XRE-family HTH domain
VNLANNIKTLRLRRKLKQRDAAARAGVAQSTWCDWESGTSSPRAKQMPRIAEVLGVKVSRLWS